MKTIEQLKQDLKDTLLENKLTYVNDGSLSARVNENIQWAWDNWEAENLEGYFTGEKPENYTAEFMVDWINNEDLWSELEQVNNN